MHTFAFKSIHRIRYGEQYDARQERLEEEEDGGTLKSILLENLRRIIQEEDEDHADPG